VAYLDDEASTADGDVTELYDFTGPTASYRYTSGATAVTYGGNSYTPAPGLRRSALEHPTSGGEGSLTVTLRASETVVVAFAFAAPPRSLRLRIYRQQANSGETTTIWDGEVVAIEARGALATVRTLSKLGAWLRRQIPGLAASWRCPHRLYDARCKLTATDWDLATTVSSVSGGGTTIVVASVGGQPDDWFAKGAEILRVSDGERRIVYRQVGTTLTINDPFPTLTAGDSVTLFAGCDHTHRFYTDFVGTILVSGDCQSKFSNAVNFGGEPSMPGSNPFTLNIRYVRKD
jgi:uncharacterized phage protein (TIGR02218 family)